MSVERDLVDWARAAIAHHLETLPQRRRHVQATARLADAVAAAYPGHKDRLVAGLLLHDIGYAPELAKTGFHPLDGARFVRDQGYPDLAALVAHHTGARYEATLRGMEALEEEFPYRATGLGAAMTYCDLTTSPTGERIRLHARVAEIQRRYGRDHLTARAIVACLPEFELIVKQVERRLAMAGVQFSGSLAYPD